MTPFSYKNKLRKVYSFSTKIGSFYYYTYVFGFKVCLFLLYLSLPEICFFILFLLSLFSPVRERMVKLLLLVGLIVACWLILGTQANEYLDFNVTEIDRNEELEFGFSKYSSNLNPLLVGLTLIRGADSGAGTLSASVTRSLFIYFFFLLYLIKYLSY